MTTSRRLSFAALSGAFASLAFSSAALAQGTLTPPGAPTPIMKTLDQIEARKPLGTPNVVTTSTITISEPGSYVLVGPVTVASGDGIVINASNVTLDLNGFTLTSTAADGTDAAIRIAGDGTNVDSVSISNGCISGAYTVASDGTGSGTGFNNGIYCYLSNPRNVRVSHVSIRGIRSLGIWLTDGSYNGQGSIISDCQTNHTGSTALTASTVDNCSVSNTGTAYYGCIYAFKVTNCFVSSPKASIGIAASLVVHSTAIVEGTGISATTVTDSYGNGATGIGATCVTNSVGFAAAGTGTRYGINSNGTVSFSRGYAPPGGDNRSIKAAIAVASSNESGSAPIESPSKQLGTP